MTTVRFGLNSNCDYTGDWVDNSLNSTNTRENNNYGISDNVQFGADIPLTFLRTGLFYWDLSDLDPIIGDSTSELVISSATLKIYIPTIGDSGTIITRRMLVEWLAGSKDGATAGANESCWNYRVYDSTAWNTVGARGGADCDRVNDVTISGIISSTGWKDLDVTGIVRRQFDDDTYYGVGIYPIGIGGWYRQSNHATAAERPYLEIVLAEASGEYANDVNGVAAAYIAKVNGVAAANIAKVNGV